MNLILSQYKQVLDFISKWNKANKSSNSIIDDKLINEYKKILPIAFEIVKIYNNNEIRQWLNEHGDFIYLIEY